MHLYMYTYMFEQIIYECINLFPGQIAKTLGDMWKTLAEKEKYAYNEQFRIAQEKVRLGVGAE